MRRLALLLLLSLLVPSAARADEAHARTIPAPDESYVYESPRAYPSFAWIAAQLLPSPEIGIGHTHRLDEADHAESRTQVAFGLRWQATPILWSWGTNRHVNRWRFLVVDPLARVSGSLELDANLEYLWGHVDRFLVRPGVRGNFPLLHRGEYLSVAIGTSTYQYDGAMRVAYDGGVYALFGTVGLQYTYAPSNAALTSLATLRLRFF